MTRSRHLHAFTLIELLVVISIIALLIGILLPALGAARESARAVLCQTHVKNISTAFVAYGTDNKQFWAGWARLGMSDPENKWSGAWMKPGSLVSVPPADPADRVRVYLGEEGRRADDLAYRGHPLAPSVDYNLVTAAAALPVLLALLPGAAPSGPDASDALAIAICHAHHAPAAHLRGKTA